MDMINDVLYIIIYKWFCLIKGYWLYVYIV